MQATKTTHLQSPVVGLGFGLGAKETVSSNGSGSAIESTRSGVSLGEKSLTGLKARFWRLKAG